MKKTRRPLTKDETYYCLCGCEEKIEIKTHYKYMGVPSFINGHNLRLVPPGMQGKKHKSSTKKLMSEKHKGCTPWNTGLTGCFSKETTDNWSGKRKGKSTWSKGKKLGPLSAEHKQRISDGQPTKGKSKYAEPDYHLDKECKCGCGEQIIVKSQHRYTKIPDHIYGHSSEDTINKIREKRKYQVFPVKDSSIEIKLQEKLKEHNIDFETHKGLTGQPDIFIEPNICIFADGDYWHANPTKYKENDVIIGDLTAKNIWEKDNRVTKKLTDAGYKTLRFWEHELNNTLEDCFYTILNTMTRSNNNVLL